MLSTHNWLKLPVTEGRKAAGAGPSTRSGHRLASHHRVLRKKFNASLKALTYSKKNVSCLREMPLSFSFNAKEQADFIKCCLEVRAVGSKGNWP